LNTNFGREKKKMRNDNDEELPRRRGEERGRSKDSFRVNEEKERFSLNRRHSSVAKEKKSKCSFLIRGRKSRKGGILPLVKKEGEKKQGKSVLIDEKRSGRNGRSIARKKG